VVLPARPQNKRWILERANPAQSPPSANSFKRRVHQRRRPPGTYVMRLRRTRLGGTISFQTGKDGTTFTLHL
jgi:hypothetical protein